MNHATPTRTAYSPQPAGASPAPAGENPCDLTERQDTRLRDTLVDLADVKPGQRVLQVGPGSLTDLLTEFVGPTGRVTTVTGIEDTEERRRYHRIVMTEAQWDLSPDWRKHLLGRGRLVVALRIRGTTHVVAFTGADNDCLRSVSRRVCPALPAGTVDQEGCRRPLGDRGEVLIVAGQHAMLMWDSGQPINAARLHHSLRFNPGEHQWTGVTTPDEDDLSTLWLWLATRELGACGLASDTSSPALVEESTLAHLIRRPHPSADPGSTQKVELGVAAYGPYATSLGNRFATHIRKWNTATRRPSSLTAYPRRPDECQRRITVIERPSIRLAIT